jgi:hypothetical protein
MAVAAWTPAAAKHIEATRGSVSAVAPAAAPAVSLCPGQFSLIWHGDALPSMMEVSPSQARGDAPFSHYRICLPLRLAGGRPALSSLVSRSNMELRGLSWGHAAR